MLTVHMIMRVVLSSIIPLMLDLVLHASMARSSVYTTDLKGNGQWTISIR